MALSWWVRLWTCTTNGMRTLILCDPQVYMAKVNDATTAVGSSAAWFKVSEIGLPSSDPDYWGTGTLIPETPCSIKH